MRWPPSRPPGAATTKLLAQVEQDTRAAATAAPDFWSVAGATELQVLQALVHQRLAADLPGLLAEFRDLKERVDARRFWDSVATEAAFLLGLYRSLAGVDDQEKEAAQELADVLARYAGAGT